MKKNSPASVTPSEAPEQSVEAAIFAQIRDAVLNQQLPPGTRLREDEIRQIFDVSRARIRKVFARLEFEGLVTIEPNRGASVARPTVKDARNLFAARRTIEATIVREAVGKLTPAAKRLLEGHISKELAADAARDHHQMIHLSGEFHLLLAQIADNAMLEKFLRELITRESLVIQTYEKPGSPSCSGHEHRSILDAMKRSDPDKAVKLMADHLLNVESRLDLDRDVRPEIRLENIFRPR
jgi:DNA-binding GntR family transcriptional regulator